MRENLTLKLVYVLDKRILWKVFVHSGLPLRRRMGSFRALPRRTGPPP
jgi:hypothetical protein